MTELLTVTQADRDAVQSFHRIMAARLMADLKSPDRPKLGEDEGDAGTLVQAFARHRLATAEAASGAGEREGRFWLIVREPGKVPERKGSWPHREVAHRLREFIAARPRAFIDVLTIGHDGTPEVEHGPEVLQYTDGRSMSVGRKHNQRVRAAAEEALAAAPTIPATGETWDSVAAWCEQTFGPCTPYRMATRAGEELAELVEEAQSLSWSDKARIEAADVLICLSRVPGIWAAVEEKMAINRARKWNVQGDGTGYHIPATGHAATEGEGA